MRLGQELKFKNKLCNLKLGTFFSALPGLGAFGPSARFEPHAKLQSQTSDFFYFTNFRISLLFLPFLAGIGMKPSVSPVLSVMVWKTEAA